MEKIAKIINTHGIKGELKLEVYTDFIKERFSPGQIIYINFENKLKEFTIETMRLHKNHVLISLKNNRDINLIKQYQNAYVYEELKELKLKENEYLYQDLIGLEVYDKQLKYLGEVTNVMDYPSSAMLVVKTDFKEALIPFVKEIVLEVKDKIIINNIEGLL